MQGGDNPLESYELMSGDLPQSDLDRSFDKEMAANPALYAGSLNANGGFLNAEQISFAAEGLLLLGQKIHTPLTKREMGIWSRGFVLAR